jgi:hypothetical protein
VYRLPVHCETHLGRPGGTTRRAARALSPANLKTVVRTPWAACSRRGRRRIAGSKPTRPADVPDRRRCKWPQAGLCAAAERARIAWRSGRVKPEVPARYTLTRLSIICRRDRGTSGAEECAEAVHRGAEYAHAAVRWCRRQFNSTVTVTVTTRARRPTGTVTVTGPLPSAIRVRRLSFANRVGMHLDHAVASWRALKSADVLQTAPSGWEDTGRAHVSTLCQRSGAIGLLAARNRNSILGSMRACVESKDMLGHVGELVYTLNWKQKLLRRKQKKPPQGCLWPDHMATNTGSAWQYETVRDNSAAKPKCFGSAQAKFKTFP